MSTVQAGNHESRIQEAALLWSEYEHRHMHCWNAIFQLSAASVFLSGIPYLSTTATFALKNAILLAPTLAVLLVLLAGLTLTRELAAFAKVKAAYRAIQNELELIEHDTARTSRFTAYVLLYVTALLFGAVANLWVVAVLWLPFVAAKGG